MAGQLATSQSERQAFFSIDAAFAFLTAMFMFAVFSAILLSASASARSQAFEAQGDNAALRLASYALDRSAGGTGSYGSVNEVDMRKFEGLDTSGIPPSLGASSAWVQIVDDGGNVLGKAGTAGSARGVHCAQRLVLAGGEMARMEACVS